MTAPVADTALAACSREPIHIPGAIQAHGVLLVLREPVLDCVQVSANAEAYLGQKPEALLGQSVQGIIASGHEGLLTALRQEDPALHSPVPVTAAGRAFDCVLHRHDGLLIAELEPAAGDSLSRYHRQLQRIFASLRQEQSLSRLYDAMARFIARFTGYERVMIYKFDADWHGEVVGECLTADVDSYLGHHFPASDIPDQARALYARSWLRIIPDATYQPVPLRPALNPQTQRPLDLSFAHLRSVSPIHLEYLRNMDVAASMSISLIVEGKLWGLIACHHRAPRPLSYAIRAACELFGQVASLELAAKHESLRLAARGDTVRIQTRFFDFISREQNFVQALIKYTPELLQFMSATGAIIWVNKQFTLLGSTPARQEAEALTTWLLTQSAEPLLATDRLPELYPPAAAFQTTASGMLALRLSPVEHHYIIWLRPEVISTVTWAGNPDKPVDERQRIHPRKSFATWKQTVTGRSLPWAEAELSGALELRAALNALVLRRTERLIHLNSELERTNTDLNSFAYVASHDLKEPLRGIANYAKFIQEDHGDTLDPLVRQRVSTISSLAVHCEQLLDALSHYSRVGRMEINRATVNLDVALDALLDGLRASWNGAPIEVRRPRPLPSVSCDRVLVREVFLNLITNAVRYNTSEPKWVEIGWREQQEQDLEQLQQPPGAPARPIFYVADNGIGIREKHYDAIFRIFHRLHSQSQFGGGTGTGLAIVKNIIERHGGRIWINSTPGQGSTFNFTLE